MSTVDQLLFEGMRKIVREEVRAALHEHGPPSEPIVLAETEYLSVAGGRRSRPTAPQHDSHVDQGRHFEGLPRWSRLSDSTR